MEFAKIRNILFISLLTVVTLVFIFILKPIFYPIFWAAVIASILHPLYQKLRKKIKSNNLSAAIILIGVLLVIIIPLTGISSLLIRESIDLYDQFGDGSGQINTNIQKALDWVKQSSVAAKIHLDEGAWVDRISQLATSFTTYILQGVKNFTENSVIFLFEFIVMAYTLFYFVRDGEKFLRKIMYLCPLGDNHEVTFYNKFTSTARATLKVTLVIGIVQGLIGGLLFYFVGIEGALIWGLVMMALSILVGCYLVWVPAGIIMLLLGNLWQGLVILAVGVLIISTIDNIIRPWLVGKDTQMHPLLVFLSTLGGVLVFGLTGFIIGPVITSLLLAFWEMYEHYYKNELDNN
jgi:predicted PurR-regulated permease PerM